MKTRNMAAILALVLLSGWLGQACGGGGTPAVLPVIDDINGGAAGSGTTGSLFVVDGSGFGTTTSAGSGYSLEFRDVAANTVVARADVDYAAGAWTDAFIRATVPTQLATGTTYNVTVTTPGGRSNALSFLVVASVSFSPSTILWSATAPLPEARQGFQAVTATINSNTYIYAVGGNNATMSTVDGLKSNVDTVYRNQVSDVDGTLVYANWSAVTPLPVKRGFPAAVMAHQYNSLVNGNVLYVLGGLDENGVPTSTVYHAKLNADGTIPAAGAAGTWATTTALPQALSTASAVIFHGRIYLSGGNGTTGVPLSTTYAATIKTDGTLDNWKTEAPLPTALAFHQLVVIAGNLYVLGGDSAAADPLSNALSASVHDTVYFSAIDLKTGDTAAAWTTTSAMTKAREKFSAVAAGSYILVSGGLYNGNPGSSEESYAAVNADGSLGSFNGATGTHTITNSSGYSFYNHAHAFFVDTSGNPHVLILSGADVVTGDLHPDVWVQH